MDKKIFKIQSASYENIWYYASAMLIVGTVMFSIVSITNIKNRIIVIIIGVIMALALYLGDYYRRTRGQIFLLEDGLFKLQTTNGKVKWQIEIKAISRIDAEPYITNGNFFTRAFTYTTIDGKNKFINLLPYNYKQMLEEIKFLNPALEIRTEPKARI